MSTATRKTRIDQARQILQDNNRWIHWFYLILLFVGMCLILSLDQIRSNKIDVMVGEIAPEQIVAPYQKRYTSEIQLEQERELAISNVEQIYSPINRGKGREQVNKANQLFALIRTIRADNQATTAWKIEQFQNIDDPISISSTRARQLLSTSDESLTQIEDEIRNTITAVMVKEVRESDLAGIEDVIRGFIGFDLSENQEQIVIDLSTQLIVENVSVDEEKTNERIDEAVNNIEAAPITVYLGDEIVAAGEPITEEMMEVLQAYDLVDTEGIDWFALARHLLVSGLATAFIALYINRYNPVQFKRNRYWLWLLIMFLGFILVNQLLVVRPTYRYLFPAGAIAVLTAVIFEVRFATLLAFLLGAIAGYVADSSLEIAFYATVGSLLAIYTLRPSQRLTDFFRAGVFVAIGNLCVMAIFNLGTNFFATTSWVPQFFMAVLNGAIVASVVIAGLYLSGALFRIVTTLQLNDLSRFDQPLLQELVRRAPGTYHHSVMVANLAEQAADRIGADSLLARVGAFYHDIGKMSNAPYFTENQEGVNPHDVLDPYTSAAIIINHVQDGLTMARRYRLPEQLHDFIAEHHGDQILKPFYYKAMERAGEVENEAVELVDMEKFRYPGPCPRTRESGIVMLADSVEAASKAVQPNNEQAIEKLVRKISSDLIEANQLDACGLTLKDIKQIRESFIETLKGRYHVRVKYAGNDELSAANTPPIEGEIEREQDAVTGIEAGTDLGEISTARLPSVTLPPASESSSPS